MRGAVTTTAAERLQRSWIRLPVPVRAILTGVFIALPAANVWPLLLLNVGVLLGVIVEAMFLTLFVWWASGGGPPLKTQGARTTVFRSGTLSPAQWAWGVIAALCFAATIHAAIVLLFRFVAFPKEAFRQGYDLSFIPSARLRWIAVLLSAASAGICEETGFRGYMQQPIEQRSGAPIAIVVSSFFFMLLHLTKEWALVGMVPIVLGAGLLLGCSPGLRDH